MSQPDEYSPAVVFQTEETNAVAGRSTVRTAALDNELNAIAASVNAIVNNLAEIQRDDLELLDGVVKAHALASDVLALIGSAGWTIHDPIEWVSGTVYAKKDMVIHAQKNAMFDGTAGEQITTPDGATFASEANTWIWRGIVDYDAGADQTLFCKANDAAQFEYRLRLLTTDRLSFERSADGTTWGNVFSPTELLSDYAPEGSEVVILISALAGLFNGNAGMAWSVNGGATWTVAASNSGAVTMVNGTAAIRVGSFGGSGTEPSKCDCSYFGWQPNGGLWAWNAGGPGPLNIGDSTLLSATGAVYMNPSESSDGATTWVSSGPTGETWTIAGSVSMEARANSQRVLVCVEAHTAGALEDDIVANKWATLYNSQSAPASGIWVDAFDDIDEGPLNVVLQEINEKIPENMADLTFSYRNAVIGGDFGTNPWQRGTTFAAIASAAYHADCWRTDYSGTMVYTISKDSSVPTVAQCGRVLSHCLRVDMTTADATIAAGDYAHVSTRIEGYRARAIAQRTCILSFWHRHSKAGTYCVGITNSGADRSFVAEYTQDTADAWEYAEIEIAASPSAGTWNYDTGVGIDLRFPLAGGSTFDYSGGTLGQTWATGNFFVSGNQVNACDDVANNFRLALVQLEPGDLATEFEGLSFAEVLALAERYYEKSFAVGTTPAQNVASLLGSASVTQVVGAAAAQVGHRVPFKTRKRAAPTVTIYNPLAANAEVRNATAAADCTASVVADASETGFTLNFTTAGGSAAGQANHAHWAAASEL
jgi:hypothetical protein